MFGTMSCHPQQCHDTVQPPTPTICTATPPHRQITPQVEFLHGMARIRLSSPPHHIAKKLAVFQLDDVDPALVVVRVSELEGRRELARTITFPMSLRPQWQCHCHNIVLQETTTQYYGIMSKASCRITVTGIFSCDSDTLAALSEKALLAGATRR